MCNTSKDGKRSVSTPPPVVMPAKEEFVIMMLLNGCFIHVLVPRVSFCYDRGIVLCFLCAVIRAHTHVHPSICRLCPAWLSAAVQSHPKGLLGHHFLSDSSNPIFQLR